MPIKAALIGPQLVRWSPRGYLYTTHFDCLYSQSEKRTSVPSDLFTHQVVPFLSSLMHPGVTLLTSWDLKVSHLSFLYTSLCAHVQLSHSSCTSQGQVSHRFAHRGIMFLILFHLKLSHFAYTSRCYICHLFAHQVILFLISCTHASSLLHRKDSHLRSLSASRSVCGSSHLEPISRLSYTSRCCVSYLFPHQGIPFIF